MYVCLCVCEEGLLGRRLRAVQPYVLPVTEQLVAAALAGSHDGTARTEEGEVVGWDRAASEDSARCTLFIAQQAQWEAEEAGPRSDGTGARALGAGLESPALSTSGRSVAAALFEQKLLHLLGGNVLRAAVQGDHAQALRTVADEGAAPRVGAWGFNRACVNKQIRARRLCSDATRAWSVILE